MYSSIDKDANAPSTCNTISIKLSIASDERKLRPRLHIA